LEEEVTPQRTQLLKGSRWPKDRNGQELDVGDYLLFVYWGGYPTASIGQVIRIGKTGKVTARIVKTGSRDDGSEQEIKECSMTTKLSRNMINALMLDKLARD
jgi:hypothetical protein